MDGAPSSFAAAVAERVVSDVEAGVHAMARAAGYEPSQIPELIEAVMAAVRRHPPYFVSPGDGAEVVHLPQALRVQWSERYGGLLLELIGAYALLYGHGIPLPTAGAGCHHGADAAVPSGRPRFTVITNPAAPPGADPVGPAG